MDARHTRLLFATFASFVAAAPAAAQPSAAPAAAGKAEVSHAAAIASCERAARQSLGGPPSQSLDVTFSTPTVQPFLADDEQLTLRGAGSSRAGNGPARAFTYSCTVDAKTSASVGLVLRAADTHVPPPPGPAPAEPNLAELSPAACESRAATALQQRWPRVSQISFDPATRTFRQTNAARGELHGSGLAKPTPSSPPTVFTYDCEVDPRDGRVVRTAVS